MGGREKEGGRGGGGAGVGGVERKDWGMMCGGECSCLIFLTPCLSEVINDSFQVLRQWETYFICWSRSSISCFLCHSGETFFISSFRFDLDSFSFCNHTRWSTTGWCMFLGTSSIAWKCKKQSEVSKPSAEANYRSMSYVSNEVIWLRHLLEFGYQFCIIWPRHLREFGYQFCTIPYADNTSGIQIASYPLFYGWIKHIEVACHFIQEHVLSGTLHFPHVLPQY